MELEDLFGDDWGSEEAFSRQKKQNIVDKKELKKIFMPIYNQHYSIVAEHFKKKLTNNDINLFGGFKNNNKKINKEYFNLLLSVEDNIEDFLNWSLVDSQILSLREYETLRTRKKERYKSWFDDKYHQNFNYKAYLNNVEKKDNKKKIFLCPFHKEKTPSMIYYKKTGNFHCHGCGIHMNFISFLQNIFLITEKEAIWLLCEYKKQNHFNQQISPKRNMALKIWKKILLNY